MTRRGGVPIIDLFIAAAARGGFALLARLSHESRIGLFSAIFKLLFFLLPRLRTTARRNLLLCFPESTPEWRTDILRKNATEMARLVADSIRLSSLTEEWVRDHVSCPILPRYLEVLGSNNGQGLLIATGHLGSFELLGHAIGLMGYPLAAVARRFRSPRLDAWWTGLREARGNKIIDRDGAFREICSTIVSGMSVAVLFDQNIKRNHAVFSDWFGVPAATTKSLALAVLRCQVPVFVASIKYCGDERYVIEAVECNFSEVIHNQELTNEQKVAIITQRVSDEYSAMIRSFPEGWFWIHRRWKTRPEGEGETLYTT